MGWTKLDLINQAFEKFGLASYVFDLSPEQLQSAMRLMDTMIARWSAEGLRLGYPLPSGPNTGSQNDDSGLSDMAVEAVITNLALRLAPTVGKETPMALRVEAKEAYNALLALSAPPPRMRLPGTMPLGAGNKPWRGGFNRQFVVDEDDDDLQVGPDGELDFK